MSSPRSENVEQILDRFDEAWNGPTPPRIEDYLPPGDSPSYLSMLSELVKLDLERRLKRGEQPVLEEYRQRFPSCADNLAGWLDEARAAAERAALDNETDDPQIRPTLEGPLLPPPLGLPSWSVGEYEVLGQLGFGGMGIVYKARHRRLDKLVALKLLPVGSQGSGEAVARFQREMKAVGALDHPNVVEAHDAGEQAGIIYLAMKLIDGVDLERLVKLRGPLPFAEACELARQAALGLHYLHERGLIHRDVKPSNLMRTPDGTVKVLDLGLARWRIEREAGHGLTVMGRGMGTPDFLAPEQIVNAMDADARADLYGLGGTLFYLLTGRAPFAHHRYQATKFEAHRSEPPPDLRTLRPDVPAELAALVQRLLAKEPEQRFATAAEAAAALAAFARGTPLEQAPGAEREAPSLHVPAEGETIRRRTLKRMIGLATGKSSCLLMCTLGLAAVALAGFFASWRFSGEKRDDEIIIRGKPLEEFALDFVIASQMSLAGDASVNPKPYQLPAEDLIKLEQLLDKNRPKPHLTEKEQWLCAAAANLLVLNDRKVDDLSRWTDEAYLDKVSTRIGGEAKSKILQLKRESILLFLAAEKDYAHRDWGAAIKGYKRYRAIAEQIIPQSAAQMDVTLLVAMKKEALAYLQRADALDAEGQAKEAVADRSEAFLIYCRIAKIENFGTNLDIVADENKKPKGWLEKIKTGKAQGEVRKDGELWLRNENSSFSYIRIVNVDKPSEFCLRWRWRLVESPPEFRDRDGFSSNHPLAVIVAFFEGRKLIALHYVWDPLEPKGKWWIQREANDKFQIGPILCETEYPHLVVASKSDPWVPWQTYTRDVAADYRMIYKSDPPPIAAIAIQSACTEGPPDQKRVGEGSVSKLQFLKKVDGRCQDPAPP